MRRAPPAVPRSSFVQELTEQVRAYAREDQVFIIDGVRLNGRRFVTSVSDRESIEPHRLQFEIEIGVVSYWVRAGALFSHGIEQRRANEWRLQERFNL